MSAWKRPRGNLMWNNRPVGQLWRALMCETPIKRFAGMATKHFTFKYGSQFVLHNSINITKVGWRLRSGNQPIRRKPTQTQQRRQHFAQAFVLITSCWQKLIKTEKVTKQSGWHTVYPGGNSSHKAYCLPETAFLWCALMCIAFAGPRLSCVSLFHGGSDSQEKGTPRRAPFPSVAVSSWHRSEGRTP